MFDLDKWQEIYTSLKKHKLRTFLTAFGVFWGIFMLIVMLGASKGLENGVMSTLDIAANSVFLWSNKTSEPHKGLKAGRFIKFQNDDVEALYNQIPEIDVVAPRNVLNGANVTRKTKSAGFSVFGDVPEFVKVKKMMIVEGRFVNKKDMEERRKVAVIGEEVQKTLFTKDENPIGQYITIAGIYFQVVGVFRGFGRGEDVMEDAKTIYLPHKTLQTAFNQSNRISWFALLPKPNVPSSLIEKRAKEVLATRHSVAPNDLKAFGSANVEEEVAQIQGLFIGISGFSWLVSIGTIFAGVIGVSNIMLITVKERTKEIGIRKALGATPYSIVSLIIQESVVLTLISGYIGLLVGVGLVEGLNQLLKSTGSESDFFANPEISPVIAFTSLIVLVVSGALAGLVPARKAAMVNPVVALKDE